MRIVLLNPPAEKGYIRSGRWLRRTRAAQNWAPIWLMYGASLLEREGHECLLIDASASNMSWYRMGHKIADFKPDLAAVYFGYETVENDLYYADIIQDLFCRTVLVGPWTFCVPDVLDKTKKVKLATYGEFEHTLLELANASRPPNILGLKYKLGGQAVTNPRRPLCSPEELDKIPFASQMYTRFLNIYDYRQTSLEYPFAEIQGSRGCPFRCIYCTQTRAMQGGSTYRARSIKNVIEELWWIKHNLPEAKQVFFQDEALLPVRAKELSQAILDENLKICWGGLCRANLSYEILKLMEESGCRTLQIGFEKPIQSILDTIHKDITVERMEQFCRDINRTKIWNNAAFMVFPWETPEQIKFTLKWAKKTRPDRMSFIMAQPYPNTPYATYLQELRNNGAELMALDEMERWEKWAHKQYYLFHPWMWWHILSHPSKWRQVLTEARGLLGSLT